MLCVLSLIELYSVIQNSDIPDIIRGKSFYACLALMKTKMNKTTKEKQSIEKETDSTTDKDSD